MIDGSRAISEVSDAELLGWLRVRRQLLLLELITPL